MYQYGELDRFEIAMEWGRVSMLEYPTFHSFPHSDNSQNAGIIPQKQRCFDA